MESAISQHMITWNTQANDLQGFDFKILLSVFSSFNSLVEHDSTKTLCITISQQRMKALITL